METSALCGGGKGGGRKDILPGTIKKKEMVGCARASFLVQEKDKITHSLKKNDRFNGKIWGGNGVVHGYYDSKSF